MTRNARLVEYLTFEPNANTFLYSKTMIVYSVYLEALYQLTNNETFETICTIDKVTIFS